LLPVASAGNNAARNSVKGREHRRFCLPARGRFTISSDPSVPKTKDLQLLRRGGHTGLSNYRFVPPARFKDGRGMYCRYLVLLANCAMPSMSWTALTINAFLHQVCASLVMNLPAAGSRPGIVELVREKNSTWLVSKRWRTLRKTGTEGPPCLRNSMQQQHGESEQPVLCEARRIASLE
jgi:hypothetical protein